MQNCQDTFSATFTSYNELFGYQQQVSSRSQWSHCAVNQLHVEPLNHNSSCYPALKEFAPGVSSEAVEDSFNNLGLAIRFDQKLYPVRETAYKSLLDRAKVSGSGLNKLTKTELAQVLNTFLSHFRSEALVLVRDEKFGTKRSPQSIPATNQITPFSPSTCFSAPSRPSWMNAFPAMSLTPDTAITPSQAPPGSCRIRRTISSAPIRSSWTPRAKAPWPHV